MAQPHVCPTPCDEDCDSDCHEWHKVTWKRDHDTVERERRQRADA